jgi:hypothetical protein
LDQFSRNMCKLSCGFLRFLVQYLGEDVNFNGAFGVSPFLFDLRDIKCSEDQVLLLSFRIGFTKSLVTFPDISKTFSLSVIAEISVDGSDSILSNSLKFSLKLCESGFTLESDTSLYYQCVGCLAGAFVNASSFPAVCSKCLPGTFSRPRSLECLKCPPGYFSGESGQADGCLSCPAGTFSAINGSSMCLICESGYFSELVGNSNCSRCLGSRITASSRSSSRLDCVCPQGKFGRSQRSLNAVLENECVDCFSLHGISCPINSSIPFVESGYWRSYWDVGTVHECIPTFSCSETGFAEDTVCSFGYTGIRCGKCSGEYFRGTKGCISCLDSQLLTAILSLFFISSLAVLIYIFALRKSQNSTQSLRQVFGAMQTFGILSRLTSSSSDSSSFLASRIFNVLVYLLFN